MIQAATPPQPGSVRVTSAAARFREGSPPAQFLPSEHSPVSRTLERRPFHEGRDPLQDDGLRAPEMINILRIAAGLAAGEVQQVPGRAQKTRRGDAAAATFYTPRRRKTPARPRVLVPAEHIKVDGLAGDVLAHAEAAVEVLDEANARRRRHRAAHRAGRVAHAVVARAGRVHAVRRPPRRRERVDAGVVPIPRRVPVSTNLPRPTAAASPRSVSIECLRVAAAASPRLVSTECPRSRPRRRRDSSPWNVDVAAAASPQPIFGMSARRRCANSVHDL